MGTKEDRAMGSNEAAVVSEAHWYAAVGDDGTRPVVWGLGPTRDDAETEARSELEASGCSSPLTVHEITPAQVKCVLAGDVSWPLEVPS
jgi:hypothetical protein